MDAWHYISTAFLIIMITVIFIICYSILTLEKRVLSSEETFSALTEAEKFRKELY